MRTRNIAATKLMRKIKKNPSEAKESEVTQQEEEKYEE